MFQHKKFFKRHNMEYMGGQNKSNSRHFFLWVDERLKDGTYEENKYDLGSIDNKTNKIEKPKDFNKLPKDIQEGANILYKQIC